MTNMDRLPLGHVIDLYNIHLKAIGISDKKLKKSLTKVTQQLHEISLNLMEQEREQSQDP